MAVCDGMSRVDVTVSNENLYGYKIKSDVDSLERISSQVNYHNQIFDKGFMVDKRHYRKKSKKSENFKNAVEKVSIAEIRDFTRKDLKKRREWREQMSILFKLIYFRVKRYGGSMDN